MFGCCSILRDAGPRGGVPVSNAAVNPEATAKKYGLIINEPHDNELQVDLDGIKFPEYFQSHLELISQWNKVVDVRYTTSKSGNRHAYIELTNPISQMERMLFQACLGSDPLRELLTYKNTLDPKNKRPQFLFELKDAIKRVQP